ncbi:uncharacterized protein LOC134807888 [Pan troglodytes]|uniref:uncharacterized protein LOC134807888 n=1 Tax=Pan troglodytes TaxID=9598 RepID=UPI0030136BB7
MAGAAQRHRGSLDSGVAAWLDCRHREEWAEKARGSSLCHRLVLSLSWQTGMSLSWQGCFLRRDSLSKHQQQLSPQVHQQPGTPRLGAPEAAQDLAIRTHWKTPLTALGSGRPKGQEEPEASVRAAPPAHPTQLQDVAKSGSGSVCLGRISRLTFKHSQCNPAPRTPHLQSPPGNVFAQMSLGFPSPTGPHSLLHFPTGLVTFTPH